MESCIVTQNETAGSAAVSTNNGKVIINNCNKDCEHCRLKELSEKKTLFVFKTERFKIIYEK